MLTKAIKEGKANLVETIDSPIGLDTSELSLVDNPIGLMENKDKLGYTISKWKRVHGKKSNEKNK